MAFTTPPYHTPTCGWVGPGLKKKTVAVYSLMWVGVAFPLGLSQNPFTPPSGGSLFRVTPVDRFYRKNNAVLSSVPSRAGFTPCERKTDRPPGGSAAGQNKSAIPPKGDIL